MSKQVKLAAFLLENSHILCYIDIHFPGAVFFITAEDYAALFHLINYCFFPPVFFLLQFGLYSVAEIINVCAYMSTVSSHLASIMS